ncbi:OmpA family protein [Spirosoma rigui]|uniref:OmpA family protein n=1 Tax=Spirosoma rigui TaxID=564064 RepID=UPI0009AF5637|nr:OmpA family protein [Spirosoma rigui]
MLYAKTLWVILLVLWMMGSTWWHVCQIKQLCADDQPAAGDSLALEKPSATFAPDGLSIADGQAFKLALLGNFSFARSGFVANMSTLGTVDEKSPLDSLTAYLKANPGRALTIVGCYTGDEANTTSFTNLGLARAEGVKQYLIQRGIPATALSTQGELVSGAGGSGLMFTPAGDSLYGGIKLGFEGAAAVSIPDTTALATTAPAAPAPATPLPTTEAGLAAAEKFTSVFQPIDLYFPLGEATYIKTGETVKFFAEAAKYLAAHKEKKLLVTGHTDNSGDDAVNLRLSRQRANQVKARLRRSGIDQGQIAVDAKGETTPKASNDTREGRKANRRVSVVVQ